MDARQVLIKTDRGQEEIATRRFRLSATLRQSLILVDGRSSVAELRARAGHLGDLEANLDYLVAQGFAIPVAATLGGASGTGAQAMKSALIQIAEELLGDRARTVRGKIEAAAENREALLEAVNKCRKLIKLTIDAAAADRFAQRCRDLFGPETSAGG